MDKLEQIPDLFIHMSLRLQALFGLRREESIKIIPEWADRGDRLVLKDSWTKGGREREIPIRTPEQRQLIDQAKAFAKGKSLVAPRYTTYRDYLKHFRYQCERVGIHAFHGHRHFYAQARYQELTGWACPARGGTESKQLTPKQKEIDRQARETSAVRWATAASRSPPSTWVDRDFATHAHRFAHEHARSASRRRVSAHSSGNAAGEGTRRRDSGRQDRQMLGVCRR